MKWQLNVSLSVKTHTPSRYTVSYAEDSIIRDHEKFTQTLSASQFYTERQFSFTDITPSKSLKLLFDDTTKYYFIKNIRVELKAGFLSKEIGDWNGRNIQTILSNEEKIGGANQEYILLSNEFGNRQIIFNENIIQQIRSELNKNQSKLYWQLLTSIVMSIFLVLIFSSLITEWQVKAISRDHSKLNLITITFNLILFIVCINSIINVLPDKKSNENRSLATLEKLTAQNIFQYPSILTNFTNDHFAFRNSLFFVHSLIKAKLLQVSSLPDKVIIGKNGWMFDANEFTINDHRRLNRFVDEELKGMIQILKQRIQWCEARGIKYYIFIPPNRNRIYREHFPNRYTTIENYGHDRLDYYKKYLEENAQISLLDPTDSLMKYKNLHDVYYSSDTHWNIFGAWVGYNYLLNHLKIHFPSLEPIQYNDFSIADSFNNKGDLAGMLGLENIFKRLELDIRPNDTTIVLKFPSSASILIPYKENTTITNTNLKLLMFRDSYSNYLIPFLNLHFKEATYVWSYDFLPQIIEAEKPDVVILEVQQSAMIYGLLNPNVINNN